MPNSNSNEHSDTEDLDLPNSNSNEHSDTGIHMHY
jgi:hypothetical protein